jgi:hypothetical protein
MPETIAEGKFLTASQVAAVMKEFNITSGTFIDSIMGMRVEFQGATIIIYRRAYWMPPSGTSPDGWHIGYQLSSAELNWEEEQQKDILEYDPLSDTLKRFGEALTPFLDTLKWVAIAVIAYFGVKAIGLFKGMK